MYRVQLREVVESELEDRVAVGEILWSDMRRDGKLRAPVTQGRRVYRARLDRTSIVL